MTLVVVVLSLALAVSLGVAVWRERERRAACRAADDERKKSERERAEWHERLRRADRLATLGRLAGTIAHQLGTPLNVVSGRAGMIAADPQDAAVQGNAKIIAEQAKRMTTMIRELLDFARKRGIQREPTKLRTVMARAGELIAPIADARRVSIEVDDAGELSADLDSERVLQVLTNAMFHALHVSPEGGALRLSAELRKVDEPADDHAEPGEYVAITLTDERPGGAEKLPPAPMSNAGKVGWGAGRAPWQDPAASAASPDASLSLYVGQGIAREHGGWIEMAVEAAPARGARFTLHLPASGTSRSEDRRASSSGSSGGAR
jgi:two-component system, NtrC family, sensor kinase